MIRYDELALAFQARHLAVPMELAVHVTSQTLARDALERLRLGNYDQAPVIDEGGISGFVLRSRLDPSDPTAPVSQAMTEIGPGNIVSADAPVGRLLDWIINPGLLFVLDGREFMGFVTVSDFNKQPARAYFYLLMTSLETALADLVRRRFSPHQDSAASLLTDEARELVVERYEAAKADNTEADLVAYFDFSHLLRVIGIDPVLRTQIGVPSRNGWNESVGALVDLRNLVMHPARALVTSKTVLVRLKDLERRARELLERAEIAVAGMSEQNGAGAAI